MASYAQGIIKKRTVIFGVFIEDKLHYAIEVKGVYLYQSLGKYNKPINQNDMLVIKNWAKRLTINNAASKHAA